MTTVAGGSVKPYILLTRHSKEALKPVSRSVGPTSLQQAFLHKQPCKQTSKESAHPDPRAHAHAPCSLAYVLLS